MTMTMTMTILFH